MKYYTPKKFQNPLVRNKLTEGMVFRYVDSSKMFVVDEKDMDVDMRSNLARSSRENCEVLVFGYYKENYDT